MGDNRRKEKEELKWKDGKLGESRKRKNRIQEKEKGKIIGLGKNGEKGGRGRSERKQTERNGG
jgi:hypothetical protein